MKGPKVIANNLRAQLAKTGKTVRQLVGYLESQRCPRAEKTVYTWLRGENMPEAELVFVLENFFEAPFWYLYPGLPGRDGK